MDSPVFESKIESPLPDHRDLPIGRSVDLRTAAALADRIMPQEGVSAFNSSI